LGKTILFTHGDGRTEMKSVVGQANYTLDGGAKQPESASSEESLQHFNMPAEQQANTRQPRILLA
jgi:hypothetical protein